jgi:ankyrin repeat protein
MSPSSLSTVERPAAPAAPAPEIPSQRVTPAAAPHEFHEAVSPSDSSTVEGTPASAAPRPEAASQEVSPTAVKDDFHDAIKLGDLDRTKAIWDEHLDHRESLLESKRHGYTPLLLAAAQGHRDIVGFLCKLGAHITATSRSGATALHLAAERGDLEMLKCLLLSVINMDAYMLNLKGEDDTTPLMVAAANGHRHVVEFLTYRGADVGAVQGCGSTALHLASMYGRVEVVDFLARQRAVGIDRLNDFGHTALFDAAQYGKLPVVRLLLERGPTRPRSPRRTTRCPVTPRAMWESLTWRSSSS